MAARKKRQAKFAIKFNENIEKLVLVAPTDHFLDHV
jgi:hypothetical protein